MVVSDFHIVRLSVFPREADAPLAVDSDTVLPFAVSAQRFQSITWRKSQVVQAFGGLKEQQLPQSTALNIGRQFAGELPLPDPFRFFAAKALNHNSITLRVMGQPTLTSPPGSAPISRFRRTRCTPADPGSPPVSARSADREASVKPGTFPSFAPLPQGS